MSSAEEIHAQLEKEARRRVQEQLDALKEEFERLRLEHRQKLEEFSYRLDFPIPALVAPELIPEPSAPVVVAEPAAAAALSFDLSALCRHAAAIDAAQTQVDILKALLAGALHYANRAVLLVARADQMVVWKSEGFPAAGEEALRSAAIPSAVDGAMKTALEGTPVLLDRAGEVSHALSAADAMNAALIPMVVREKVSAILYADKNETGFSFEPDAIGILTFVAGVAVDRLGTRKFAPAPSLRPFRAWEGEAAPAAPEIAPAVEETPRVEPEAAEPGAPEPEAPKPERPEPAAPPRPARPVDFEITGAAYRPPAGVTPGGAQILRGALASSVGDPHEEARHVARLLVSDIRLYNEAAVAEGAREGNIYRKIKEDIDRAQQTYNERVPGSVRGQSDYFREELVRMLAGGNSEILGY